MELTLERSRCTKDFTISLLYPVGKKLFAIDVVEPPIAGLTVSRFKALDAGRYKMFLKPDPEQNLLIPVFQQVSQRLRFAFVPLQEEAKVEAIDFRSNNYVSKANLLCGRLKNNILVKDEDSYNKFMFTCILAKQQKQVIWVNIK